MTLLCALVQLPGNARAEEGLLSIGWASFPPFSYSENVRGRDVWRGLDVQLVRAIADRAGYALEPSATDWDRQVVAIADGDQDIAAAATQTPARDEFAYFSDPYRTENVVLIMRRGGPGLDAEGPVELVQAARSAR